MSIQSPESPVSVRIDLLPDEALFEGVQDGSEAHFKVLYERYFRRVYAFVHSRVHDSADAEDLTQETFSVVFSSAEGYGGRSSPLGWIYGIAKNMAYNHLRRAKIRHERVEKAGADSVHAKSPTWTCTPEEHLVMQRYVDSIGDCLHSVSSWQAEAFVMRHVENLSIGQIAERMDRSNDAIRSSLYRIKRLLVDASTGEATPVVL